MDLSNCSCDDSLYDEAFGPTATVHRCENDGHQDELEEEIFSLVEKGDDEPHVVHELGPYVQRYDNVDGAKIAEWINTRYRAYVEADVGVGLPEPFGSRMQSGGSLIGFAVIYCRARYRRGSRYFE